MNQVGDATLEFLKSHRLGALATGRHDGSPQQTMISYNFDGADIVINASGESAKTRNLSRQSRASLCVMDGAKVVVVYGVARIARGDEADAITERRLPPTGRAGAQRQESAERVVIVLTPDKIIANQVED